MATTRRRVTCGSARPYFAPEPFQKGTWRHNVNVIVLPDGQQIRVTGDEIICLALYRCRKEDAVVGIANGKLEFGIALHDVGKSLELHDTTGHLALRNAEIFADTWSEQCASKLIEHCLASHEDELAMQKSFEDLSRRSGRANECAHDDVRIQDGPQQSLLARRLAAPSDSRSPLGFQRDRHGLLFRQLGTWTLPLLLQKVEESLPCRPPHLLETLNGHQGCKGFAFAFDDEFVVTQCDPIQHVADPGTHVHGRYPLCHSNYDS